jgi:hypothetical protein
MGFAINLSIIGCIISKSKTQEQLTIKSTSGSESKMSCSSVTRQREDKKNTRLRLIVDKYN